MHLSIALNSLPSFTQGQVFFESEIDVTCLFSFFLKNLISIGEPRSCLPIVAHLVLCFRAYIASTAPPILDTAMSPPSKKHANSEVTFTWQQQQDFGAKRVGESHVCCLVARLTFESCSIQTVKLELAKRVHYLKSILLSSLQQLSLASITSDRHHAGANAIGKRQSSSLSAPNLSQQSIASWMFNSRNQPADTSRKE